MQHMTTLERRWKDSVIKTDQISRYLHDGRDFIDDALIETLLVRGRDPDPALVRGTIAKALSIETLLPEETSALLNVTDPGLWEEIFDAAARVKNAVYDNRVVTFAPLYCANRCVNRCVYCGFRADNGAVQRRVLSFEEIEREARVLAGELGHKRIVAVYGEHPSTGADYIAESIRRIYSVKVPVRKGRGEIRRVNINAAPLSIEDLVTIQEAGIGTYQVFQETYHHETYRRRSPGGDRERRLRLAAVRAASGHGGRYRRRCDRRPLRPVRLEVRGAWACCSTPGTWRGASESARTPSPCPASSPPSTRASAG